MAFEKYVKIDGRVYYESELKMMSDKQLNQLIDMCQLGIDEISQKKSNYLDNDCNGDDPEHSQAVLDKFDAVACYLQTDIVLINKIIKTRILEDDSDFYKVFYENAKISLWKRTFNKLEEITKEQINK